MWILFVSPRISETSKQNKLVDYFKEFLLDGGSIPPISTNTDHPTGWLLCLCEWRTVPMHCSWGIERRKYVFLNTTEPRRNALGTFVSLRTKYLVTYRRYPPSPQIQTTRQGGFCVCVSKKCQMCVHITTTIDNSLFLMQNIWRH